MRIISRFVDFALAKGEINVTDSGQVLSFIHIYDLIEALVEIIELISNKDIKEEIFNIGTEESYSLADIANIVKEILIDYEKDIDVNVEEVEGEYKNNSLNMTKTFNILNWRPKHYLKDIMRDEVERKIKKWKNY